ncbi:MAG: SpoIIE family protein phosphatase, partial [Erysipelotrichaceae bacterium]|nr:SpoIIE family protein phosphatase [Erysipelotrichaceae bacterium]
MAQKKKPLGILWQVALIFVGSFLLTALLSYFAQEAVSSQTVNSQTETTAQRVADEVDQTIKEVPSYAWLIQYWHDHAQQMEVEYDKDYGPGTQTEEKVRLFSQRHPEMQIRYATQEEVAALSPEDQKLFAEINYSWMVQRINQIKQSVHPDFLFIVLTQKPYDSQFFLLSGAEQGASRGTGSDDVYPLGYIETNISESQRTAMENAIHDTRYLADAGDYMDYYASLGKVGSYDLMVGVTYNVKLLKENVTKQTWSAAGLNILYQIGILNLCLALLYFFILRPLKIIQENIRAYEETKDSDAVARNMAQIKTGNEMEVLAKDVTGLSKEIDEYIKNIENITAEKERIGTELALASRIQFSTLPNVFPPFPERSEFDLFATMNPAKEVGGDFYDFFMVDETHLAILIADVSGKSIPAALFMMVSMILIHNTADNLYSPAEVLTRVNNQLCAHNPEDMFVSVWLGIVDIT